jgi:hypothetical protein
MFTSGGSASEIVITGGDIKIVGSDGLDSNGTVTISGGRTVVLLAENTRGDEALDSDGGIFLNGGEIIFGGSSTGAPSASSEQSYVIVSSVSAGSVISVKQNDVTLMTYTAEVSVNYLGLSCPGLVQGESFDIYNGSSKIGAVTAGTGATGMGGMTGGNNGGFGRNPGGFGNGAGTFPTAPDGETPVFPTGEIPGGGAGGRGEPRSW